MVFRVACRIVYTTVETNRIHLLLGFVQSIYVAALVELFDEAAVDKVLGLGTLRFGIFFR